MDYPALPPIFSLVPFVGACVIVGAAIVWARKERIAKANSLAPTLTWTALFTLILITLGFYVVAGLFHGDAIDLSGFCLVTLACGLLSLWRNQWFSILESHTKQRHVLPSILNVVLLALSALLCLFAIELPWNDHFPFINPLFVFLEWAMVFLPMMCFYFLAQRHGGGSALVVLACAFIGAAAYFVWLFRGAAILPSDVLALGTAVDVAERFEFTLTGSPTHGLAAGVSALGLLAFVYPRKNKGVKRLVGNVVYAAVFACLMATLVLVPSYRNTFGTYISNGYWTPFVFEDYKWNGFLPSFMTAVQDLPIAIPENYSATKAESIIAQRAKQWEDTEGKSERREQAERQFEQDNPCVVIIQNESFADLSEFNELEGSYQGPHYFRNGITDTLTRGQIAVPNIGGGTCNAEFEFLTGFSLAYFGAGKYPFSMYNLDKLDALPQQFKKLGYHTVGIHPENAANWHRDEVYELFGFDEFLTIDDYENAERVHNAVSDWATYATILERLRSDNRPQFIFDVTMQNHSGYEQGQIPEDKMTHLSLANLEDKENSWLNEYLGGIEDSDRSLASFVANLQQLERPVVLVFYGDHQPFFTETINDLLFPNEENELVHIERIYHTDYLVWANYAIDRFDISKGIDNTSTCYLAAMTLDIIGAPLTDFQKMQLSIRQEMPAINVYGCRDAANAWHELGAGSTADAYRDFGWAEYLHCIERL